MDLALGLLANGTLENYLMNVPTHPGPKEVFLKHVNGLVEPKNGQPSLLHAPLLQEAFGLGPLEYITYCP